MCLRAAGPGGLGLGGQTRSYSTRTARFRSAEVTRRAQKEAKARVQRGENGSPDAADAVGIAGGARLEAAAGTWPPGGYDHSLVAETTAMDAALALALEWQETRQSDSDEGAHKHLIPSVLKPCKGGTSLWSNHQAKQGVQH